MTPQELHTAVDARRRERELKWWQVAVQVDTSVATLNRLRRGAGGPVLLAAVRGWLDRSAGG